MAYHRMKRNDTLDPLWLQLSEPDGSLVDFTTATSVTLTMKSSDGLVTKFTDRAPELVTPLTLGELLYLWQVGDTDTVGEWQVEVEIIKPTGKKTYPTRGTISVIIEADLNGT